MRISRPNLVDLLAALLALVCLIVLFVVVGPVAGLAGGLAFLVWLLAPVYGFAIGQFGLLAALPDAAISSGFAVAQATLFALLILGFIRRRASALGLLAFLVAGIALVGGVLAGVARGEDSLALAGGLVGVIALTNYLLHRYELVMMDLAGEEA